MSVASRLDAELSVGETSYEVQSYHWERKLSALEVVRCVMHAKDKSPLDAASLLSKEAKFSLKRTGEKPRTIVFAGDVVRARQLPSERHGDACELTLAPLLWKLTQRRTCHTYQKATVQKIVQQVLKRSKIEANAQKWPELGLTPRTYVVQYRETDLEFCERILAEAGIYYSLELSDPQVLLFGADPQGFGEIESPEIPFKDTFGDESVDDAVFHLKRSERIRPGSAEVRDYDPWNPKLDFKGKHVGHDSDKSLEVYEYPSRQPTPDAAKTRAQQLLEALSADRAVVTGQSLALHLAPGFRFTIEDHPYEALNGPHLVTEVRYSGDTHYERRGDTEVPIHRHYCEFEAIPSAVPYRPPHREPARRSSGLQTATTTGASGAEIDVDGHGRVTVQYPWDREGKNDGTSSLPIRTSQLPTGGSMLLPRVAWEVTVGHTDGDIDAPLVMGRLYNGKKPPPYKLPDNAARSSIQTATSPGDGTSNEIRMSDVKGDEQMFFNASYDMSVDVGNNTTLAVGNDHKVKVGVDHSFASTDSFLSTVGVDQKLEVGANQSVTVGTLMVEDVTADHSLTVGANRGHMVGGDHRRTVDGSSSHEVGGNEIAVVAGDVSNTTSAAYSHSVGAAFIQIVGGDRSLIVGAARSETTGAAKVILAKGGVGLEAGSLSLATGGAVVANIKGDVTETDAAGYTATVAGAASVKAKNVVIEGESEVSLKMGGASIKVTPSGVTLSGSDIKLDGNVVDLGIIKDN